MTHTLVVALVGSYLCLIGALLGLVWNERWQEFKAGAESAMAPVAEDPAPLEEEPLVVDPEPTLREKLILAGLGPLNADDTFTRTVSNARWGTADTGQAWIVTGGDASDYSVAGLGPLSVEHTCGPQCIPPTGPVLQDRWRVHTACFDAYADRLPARVCATCRPVLLGVRGG